MFYAISHLSKFRYSAPISESMMEVRMQPRTEEGQRCLSFELATVPRAHITSYTDYLGNRVHHFDVPDRHGELAVTAQAVVEITAPPPLPEALPPSAWSSLEAMAATDEHWDWLKPSRFARPSPLLHELAAELGVGRGPDPLSTLRAVLRALREAIAYVPQSTRADSPIDDALRSRKGVCQDFAHITIALVRDLGIPCRYVSGYLCHDSGERSTPGATHAWVEALLPGVGWASFDPTNGVAADERHIRVALGRDYDDVAPTHGVFKGTATSDLAVAVYVGASETVPVVESAGRPVRPRSADAWGGQQ